MKHSQLVTIGLMLALLGALPAMGQDAKPPPASITTPDKVGL